MESRIRELVIMGTLEGGMPDMAGPGEGFSHVRQVDITRLVDSHSYLIYLLLQLLRRGLLLRRALSRTPACDSLSR